MPSIAHIPRRQYMMVDEPLVRIVRSDVTSQVVLCAVSGEVDILSAEAMAQALMEIQDEAVRAILVDLSELAYLSISGVQVLLSAARRATALAQEFNVVSSGSPVRRAFEVTGAEAELVWYPNKADAVAALTSCFSGRFAQIGA